MQPLTRRGHNHSKTALCLFTLQRDQSDLVCTSACLCVFHSWMCTCVCLLHSQKGMASHAALACMHICLFALMVCVCVCVCMPWQISPLCKPLIGSAANLNKAGITNKLAQKGTQAHAEATCCKPCESPGWHQGGGGGVFECQWFAQLRAVKPTAPYRCCDRGKRCETEICVTVYNNDRLRDIY